jgi:hypothetical protein
MATTGTNTFIVSRDDIIKGALRLIGALGVGETPITEDYTNCSQNLNIMIKGWAKKGMPLWVTQDLSIPMINGVNSYVLGPTATGTGSIIMARPLRIIEGTFIRDVNNNDTTLTLISRQEYSMQSTKNSGGVPNQFYYDRQEPNGILSVINVPVISTSVIHAQIQRQFYDMTSGTDYFDFPEEFFQALKWGLAAEIAAEYGVSLQMIPYYEGKAEKFIEESFNYSVEEASIYFSMDPETTVQHAQY